MSGKYRVHNIDALIQQEIYKYQQGKWRRRLNSVLGFLYCSRRTSCTWFLVSLFSSAIYAVVIYFALLAPDLYSPGANNLPFFHVPLEYNVTLRLDENYLKNSLHFTGKTRILFQSTILTPNFLINVGDNLQINQLYFENYPSDDSFSAIKLGYNPDSQIQSYVINHVFEDKKEYVAVIDFEGSLFPANARGRTPKLFTFSNNDTDSYAIVHFNRPNATFGLRYITPSFDSNTYPSKFNLQIQHENDYNAISNMPVISTQVFNETLTEDIFASSVTLFPTQFAFAVTNLKTLSKKNCPSNMNVNVHYRTSTTTSVDSQRLLQIVANTTNNIFKIDGVLLPNVETIEQPGITLLNEDSSLKLAQTLSDKVQLLDSC